MPVVEISLFAGRTKEQKRAIARAIASVLVDLADAKPETIEVLFREYRREDWIKGEEASDGVPR